MTLGEHLLEARNRLLICAVAVLLATIVGWFFSDQVLQTIAAPFDVARKELNLNAQPNFAGVGTSLDIKLRMSAYFGLIAASPVILWEAWRFITPGLKKNERKYALGFMGAAVPLFFMGCAAGYYAMSKAVPLFMSFTPENFTNIVDFGSYMNLFIRTVLVFGIAFTLPVFLVALNMLGVLRGRTMLKAWRWVVFLIFLFTAIMVPTPDPFTMIFMAMPICGFYFIAVGISIRNDKKRDARLEAMLNSDVVSDIGEVEDISAPSDISRD
ncbi:twin-arginine translocase subunit TatC [Dermabacteraceae bacterium TAE3-ERU27]|nr:twin-arginine translocase subunit TatC [Dermabacteraceae bacterium TAE3-ERU27]